LATIPLPDLTVTDAWMVVEPSIDAQTPSSREDGSIFAAHGFIDLTDPRAANVFVILKPMGISFRGALRGMVL
jgi:hypothetical protein